MKDSMNLGSKPGEGLGVGRVGVAGQKEGQRPTSAPGWCVLVSTDGVVRL